MPASIDLNVVENSVDTVDGVPVGYLKLKTQNPQNVPDAKWFIVRRVGEFDELVCVASVADFTNVSDSPPVSADVSQLWRTDEVEYYTDFPDDMAEAIANVKRRIQAAIDAFNLLTETPSGQITHFE